MNRIGQFAIKHIHERGRFRELMFIEQTPEIIVM